MPINIKKRVEFMLLNYMFHLRVNPVGVRVVAYSRKIQDSVWKKKMD